MLLHLPEYLLYKVGSTSYGGAQQRSIPQPEHDENRTYSLIGVALRIAVHYRVLVSASPVPNLHLSRSAMF